MLILKAFALLLVAASLFYSLWAFFRGGWLFLVLIIWQIIIVAQMYMFGIYVLAAFAILMRGITRRDLSAVAAAMVMFAALRLVIYLLARLADLRLVERFEEFVDRNT